MAADIRQTMKRRVVLFNGAMGTMLPVDRTVSCNEVLNLSSPETVAGVHRAYLAAGADIIITNTFGASRVSLSDHNMAERVRDINLAAVRIARNEASNADGERFVAGELGPTSKLPTLGHIAYADLFAAYLEQADALAEGGVDLFITSTSQDPLQVKAALAAIEEIKQRRALDLPVVVSVTMEPAGTMLLGTDIMAVLAAAAPFAPLAFGINCSTGPDAMEEHLYELSRSSPFAIVCQPNAGMPENVNGKPKYSMDPDKFASLLSHLVMKYGLSFAGGCCGTTPDHIRALALKLKQVNTVKQTRPKTFEYVSSLYSAYALAQKPAPFVIAEQTNVNGSKKFRELLLANDFDAMADIARTAANASHALDLCLAYAGRDEVGDVRNAVSRIATKADAAVMIDSTNPNAIEAALSMLPGRSIVNSINLEDGGVKAKKIAALVRKFGAALVCLCIDETGMAKTAEKKLEVAKRLVSMVEGVGIARENLLVDCLTFTLVSGDAELRSSGKETLDAIGLIKKEIPGVRTLLGLSNVSFGLPPQGRQWLTSVFMHMAVERGLDAAIVNPTRVLPLEKIPADVKDLLQNLINDDRSGGDPLTMLIKRISGDDSDKIQHEMETQLSPADAMKRKIVDGSKDGLKDLVETLVGQMEPAKIINDVLLPAMQEVGRSFGAGRTPLPFVLASAETMRAAIDLVSPHLKSGRLSHRATMVLATVRGDVHDIGKNLVDAILSNNGFKVVNLGIRQAARSVIEAAREHNADAIGLSGLLVSSTEIMREDLEIFREAGLKIPVLCGGAALTESFVNGPLTEAYGGKVFYCADAFAGLKAMEEVAKER